MCCEYLEFGGLFGLIDGQVGCAAQEVPTSSCSPTDYFCLCSDQTLLERLSLCAAANCTIRDGLSAKNQTLTLCRVPSRDDSGTIARLAPAVAVISFVFVVIRLIARWKMLDYSDLCIGIAWLTGLTVSILNVLSKWWPDCDVI